MPWNKPNLAVHPMRCRGEGTSPLDGLASGASLREARDARVVGGFAPHPIEPQPLREARDAWDARISKLTTTNYMLYTVLHGGRSQVVRRWTVTPLLAGSNPVVRPFSISNSSWNVFSSRRERGPRRPPLR